MVFHTGPAGRRRHQITLSALLCLCNFRRITKATGPQSAANSQNFFEDHSRKAKFHHSVVDYNNARRRPYQQLGRTINDQLENARKR
jgi:hypothetical protein